MRFILKNSRENILSLARKAGYYALRDSFVRPLERSGYPRFHLYVKQEKDDLIFSLHLDQKRPVYKGVSAHAGEYEGKVVEQEAERIKQSLE